MNSEHFFEQPCTVLTGIGPAVMTKLKQCRIETIQDLIFHLPYRYQDRTRVTSIQDLRLHDWSVVVGKVSQVQVSYKKRMVLTCLLEDQTGFLKLRFFHFNKQQIIKLKTASLIKVFGEIKQFSNQLEMIHPEYTFLDEETPCLVDETLTPIYPTTEGLRQTRLRQMIEQGLMLAKPHLSTLEWMSEEKRLNLSLPSLAEALETLHHPPPTVSLHALENGEHPSLKRLVLEELMAKRLSMQFAKEHWKTKRAPAFIYNPTLIDCFLKSLPFSLTKAQERVYQEVHEDLIQDKPMLRLVQGDVGSGKTIVAALAALEAISAGHQVAFMAPTELLSEQHATNFERWFAPFDILTLRLRGKMKANEKKQVLSALKENRPCIVIGTHALFQESVVFYDLGLIIIDEQHRFGVEQRLRLQQKSQQTPHQLMMTATPIPRTLAMTQYAHLDLSVIDELPPGRTPIVTTVMSQEKRPQIIERLNHLCQLKKQAYWVCTLIEESENLQCIAATQSAEILAKELPNARVGLIHGRMLANEKEETMQAFKAGTIDLLVATTVIEVGVDVPNASLMIIENAERLGLSQLHQLRGRVGRGSEASHCLLLYQTPLSHTAKARLTLMRETNDGFLIAEKDLHLRGSGHLLGTQQTGYRTYKIASFPRDTPLLSIASEEAQALSCHNKPLAKQLVSRWLGGCEVFFQV